MKIGNPINYHLKWDYAVFGLTVAYTLRGTVYSYTMHVLMNPLNQRLRQITEEFNIKY